MIRHCIKCDINSDKAVSCNSLLYFIKFMVPTVRSKHVVLIKYIYASLCCWLSLHHYYTYSRHHRLTHLRFFFRRNSKETSSSFYFLFTFRNKPSPVAVVPLKLRESWSSSRTWKVLSVLLNTRCPVSVVSLLASLARAWWSWRCLQLCSQNVFFSQFVC